ncbi:MAG: phosphoketolase family protein, partial [Clostridia bacterium]|nr:phosphoketolase family protein [Clostridia bacterium]
MKEDIFSTDKYLSLVNEYWNAANYLTVAQLYLMRNALLEDKLTLADVKPRLVGHWGTCPGQNFVYAHCNRVINKYKLNMMLLSGPGHGGNFFVSNSYLEGAYSEVYPNVSQDKQGLDLLCKQFSFPKGISSHVAPETPGSINEGGELGYSLAHAFGAVLDNPSLIATVIVGDGEAETGPLATSWHGNKFINPKTDGAVLPILHLNGYKISNPTVLSRIDKKELESLMVGYGYKPYFVEGDDPKKMHKAMAKAMDVCIETIKNIQANARKNKTFTRAVWPMIVLRTPKGWTGPKVVDGKQVEGCFRAHQVPLVVNDEKTLSQLKDWLRSYHPEKLFVNYKLRKDIADILPKGKARISANPHTNGGVLLKPLKTPNVKDYEVKVTRPGKTMTQDMLELGGYIRDVFKLNFKNANYRIFSPDEAMSNRMYKVFDTENRSF